MDDFNTASTESSTPSDSTPDVSTSASATGDGESTATAQAPEATATESSDFQTDIGWSLEEQPEQESPKFVIPDNDDDLEPLMNEPGLDPEKTPGLVQKIKELRSHIRAEGLLRGENGKTAQVLAQQQALETAFEPFGGQEGAVATLNTTAQLFMDPEKGVTPYLQHLHENANDVFQHLFNGVLTADPGYAIWKLQQEGHLPTDLTQQSGSIDQERLNALPEQYRDVAKNMPAKALEDILAIEDPELRDWYLDREAQLQNLNARDRAREEAAQKAEWQGAQDQGRQQFQQLEKQYTDAHYKELAKWTPFGPDQKDLNGFLHQSIFEGAFLQLLQDQKFQQMYNDAQKMMHESPLKRLSKQVVQAEADERKARQYAMQINTRLGQHIGKMVKSLDQVFRQSRQWQESQRNSIPNRTEIGGQGAQQNGGGKMPNAIDPRTGQITADWEAQWIAQNTGQRGS